MKFPNSIWTPVMSKQGTWIFRGKHNGNPCLVIINQDNATMINVTPAEEYLEGMYYGPIPEPPDDDKYYIVTTEEVYRVSYVVRADSPDKAIVILNKKDMEKVYDKEYMAINHTDEWEVEEATKAEIEFAVRKNLYYS